MARLYIGLGSNLERPLEQVTRALEELDRLPSTRMTGHSALYRTQPVGPPNQPDYINAVAALTTALRPLVVLGHLKVLERRHGRRRLQKWGPRSLDLDILLCGGLTLRHPRLVVPHPLLHRRGFVLIPLNEIAPEVTVPGKGRVGDLAARLTPAEKNAVRKI